MADRGGEVRCNGLPDGPDKCEDDVPGVALGVVDDGGALVGAIHQPIALHDATAIGRSATHAALEDAAVVRHGVRVVQVRREKGLPR